MHADERKRGGNGEREKGTKERGDGAFRGSPVSARTGDSSGRHPSRRAASSTCCHLLLARFWVGPPLPGGGSFIHVSTCANRCPREGNVSERIESYLRPRSTFYTFEGARMEITRFRRGEANWP